MNLSTIKYKVVDTILKKCVRRSGFKNILLKQIKEKRFQYPDWNNNTGNGIKTGGVDFTFIEYFHCSSPHSSYLHDIANRAVHVLEKEWHEKKDHPIPSDLRVLYDYNNHYLLLTAIAKVTNAKNIVEVGTAAGSSLWSWLRLDNIKSVSTWDIFPIETCTGWFHNDAHQKLVETLIHNDERWTQYVERLDQESIWALRKEIFAQADIIFIDGPHNGTFEQALFQNILQLENKKNILLILDDIHVSSMLDFWHSIALPKLDATSIGHQSGTGLILLLPYQERS